MHLMTRRRVLAASVAAVATVALAVRLRKFVAPGRRPGAAEHRPEAVDQLRDLTDALQPLDPPKPLPFIAADGRSTTLADFVGKGVLLNLWATWCVPCDAELPSLDVLAGSLAAEGIVVLPLSSDRGGAPVVERYYKAHGITHLGIWTDPEGAALHALGARGIPTTLILDRQGRERARLEGGIDWAGDDAAGAVRKLTG